MSTHPAYPGEGTETIQLPEGSTVPPSVPKVTDRFDLDSTTANPDDDSETDEVKEPRRPMSYTRLKWLGLLLVVVLAIVATRLMPDSASGSLTVPVIDVTLPINFTWLIVLLAFIAITVVGMTVGQAPSPNHPTWLKASMPIGRGPRRLIWTAYYVGWDLYRLRAVPLPRTTGLYSERRRENKDFVYDNRKKTGGTTLIKSGKGGPGKSTLSHVISVEERVVTSEPVLVIDTDSGGGAIIKRFELTPEDTLSTDELVNLVINCGWTPNISDVNQLLGFHLPTGVAVTYMDHGSHINPSDFDWTVRALRNVFHSIVIDTTPGYKEKNILAAIRNASVVVIPGNIHADDDMDQVIQTLNHPEYELRARYERGEGPIVAISAVRWWQYNVRTVYELAERFDVDPEYIVLLPYSRWLKNQRPVNYQRDAGEYGWPIKPKYRYAISCLQRRKAEVALQHNLNNQPFENSKG